MNCDSYITFKFFTYSEGYSVVHFLNNTVTSANIIAYSSSSQSDANTLSRHIILHIAIALLIKTDSDSGYGGAINLFDGFNTYNLLFEIYIVSVAILIPTLFTTHGSVC